MQAIFRVKDAAALATTFAIYNEYVNQDHSGDPCYNDNFAAATSMVTKHYGTQGSETYEQLIVSGERQAFPKDWLKKVRGLELDGCIELVDFESTLCAVHNGFFKDKPYEDYVLPYWMDLRDFFQIDSSEEGVKFWSEVLREGLLSQWSDGEPMVLPSSFAQPSLIGSAEKWLSSQEPKAIKTKEAIMACLKLRNSLETMTAETIENLI